MNNQEFREKLVKAGTTYEIFKKEWTNQITANFSPLTRAWVFIKQIEHIKTVGAHAGVSAVLNFANTSQGAEYWKNVLEGL